MIAGLSINKIAPKLVNEQFICVCVNVATGKSSGSDFAAVFSSFGSTHVEQGGLDHFPQLLNLLLTSTHITVGHIGLLLYLQHDNKELVL